MCIEPWLRFLRYEDLLCCNIKLINWRWFTDDETGNDTVKMVENPKNMAQMKQSIDRQIMKSHTAQPNETLIRLAMAYARPTIQVSISVCRRSFITTLHVFVAAPFSAFFSFHIEFHLFALLRIFCADDHYGVSMLANHFLCFDFTWRIMKYM